MLAKDLQLFHSLSALQNTVLWKFCASVLPSINPCFVHYIWHYSSPFPAFQGIIKCSHTRLIIQSLVTDRKHKIFPLLEVNYASQNNSACISLPSMQGRLSQGSSSLKHFLAFLYQLYAHIFIYCQFLSHCHRFQQFKYSAYDQLSSAVFALGKILSNHVKLVSSQTSQPLTVKEKKKKSLSVVPIVDDS